MANPNKLNLSWCHSFPRKSYPEVNRCLSCPARFATLDKRERNRHRIGAEKLPAGRYDQTEWVADKRYQIVEEALTQIEPIEQIAGRHRVQAAVKEKG